MRNVRRAIRRAAQVLLCASALAGGAGLAYATQPSLEASAGRFPRPMPEVGAMPALTSVRADPLQRPSITPRREPEEVFEEDPLDTFAPSLRDGMVITGATPHRLILFTFDDGPDQRTTPRLLDLLDQQGIRAVFFLTAHRISEPTPWQEGNREVAREIVRRGHIVANHTIEHQQLPLLDTERVVEEVRGADAIFERVLGERTWLVRPPGGSRSPRVDNLIADGHHTQVLWNLGTGDFQVRSSEDVVRTFQRVLARRERENGERGGIVLLHDTHEWSVEAVPHIVSWLRERNCELLAEGEELYDIVDDPRYFHVERAEHSPSEEAPAAELPPELLAARQRRARRRARRFCDRIASR